MPRPRIEGMDEKIILSFIERGIYKSQKDVLSAALRALVKEQKFKEASIQSQEAPYTESTYEMQLGQEPSESFNKKKKHS
jgi:Arc/MetJ-type ribon-helix-helix transcriptional regulator